MTMQIYTPRMRQIPPPCPKECPDRQAGCAERCCTWALYLSTRNYIYDVNHRARRATELDQQSAKIVARAAKKERRGRSYAAK